MRRLRPWSFITWQDRQKVVEVARSICAENPAQTETTGRMSSARKARILPSRDRVRRARNPTTRASTPVRTTRNGIRIISFRETAVVFHYRLDLVLAELLTVAVHIVALTVLNDLNHLVHGEFLDRLVHVHDLELAAFRSLTRAVLAVADCARVEIDVFGLFGRPGGGDAQGDECAAGGK